MTNRTHPFGNPDGSRSDIQELLDDFVSFPEGKFGHGLGLSEADSRVRIIIGAKGAGKTVYLRKQHVMMVENDAVFADPIQQDLPTTADVIKFCQAFPPGQVTEFWSQIWNRAILVSVRSAAC